MFGTSASNSMRKTSPARTLCDPLTFVALPLLGRVGMFDLQSSSSAQVVWRAHSRPRFLIVLVGHSSPAPLNGAAIQYCTTYVCRAFSRPGANKLR